MHWIRIAWWISILWGGAEIGLALFRRSPSNAGQRRDAGTLRLFWITISLSVTAAVVLQMLPLGRFPWPAEVTGMLATGLLVTGLAIRFTAMVQLGRYFTTDVTILAGHRLVTAGLYRYVRHPAYTGMLLAFLGLGVSFSSWVSVAVLAVPIFLVTLRRIAVEERVLAETFGQEFLRYKQRTKRLLPGIF
jgi:protein-S-isoprenylcysteine O-methyltransferase Ste14